MSNGTSCKPSNSQKVTRRRSCNDAFGGRVGTATFVSRTQFTTRTTMKGIDWDEALSDFERANKRLEENTVNYYKYQLAVLVRWAKSQGIELEGFHARHMDAFRDLRKNIGYP